MFQPIGLDESSESEDECKQRDKYRDGDNKDVADGEDSDYDLSDYHLTKETFSVKIRIICNPI